MELASPVGAILGEGPIWDPARNRLLFVDLYGPHVYARGADGRIERETVAPYPSAVFPSLDGASLIACDRQLHALPGGAGRMVLASPGLRLNDGIPTSRGSLLFGAVSRAPGAQKGLLVEIGPNSARPLMRVPMPNGMAWTPDQRLYVVDSHETVVWELSFDHRGDVQDRKLLRDMTDVPGKPDGVAIDTDGCLWVALWGGGMLVRIAPDGRLVGSASVPCRNVTSCSFGGTDLATLFVTTACDVTRGRQEPITRREHDGDLFALEGVAAGANQPRLARAAALLSGDDGPADQGQAR